MTCTELEKEVVSWVTVCERLRLPVVSGAAIRAKADQIRDRMACSAPDSSNNKLAALSFSSGWLDKMKKRHIIKSRVLHGEAASASQRAVDEGRAALHEITSTNEKQDIFNLDETAYFFCSASTRTHAQHSYAGRKQSKKRITVAMASNRDGSARVPLLFIGTAKQPRCFGGSKSDELGIDYCSSARGWMTMGLFKRWLQRFDSAMRDAKRSVLLLLDNASCHRVNCALSNVKLWMLPPNTTAHLQPLDSGIISAFKARVQAIKNGHVVTQIDALTERAREISKDEITALGKRVYDVDALTEIRWAEEAWAAVRSETIANCWRHTVIVDEDSYELVDSMERLQLK